MTNYYNKNFTISYTYCTILKILYFLIYLNYYLILILLIIYFHECKINIYLLKMLRKLVQKLYH